MRLREITLLMPLLERWKAAASSLCTFPARPPSPGPGASFPATGSHSLFSRTLSSLTVTHIGRSLRHQRHGCCPGAKQTKCRRNSAGHATSVVTKGLDPKSRQLLFLHPLSYSVGLLFAICSAVLCSSVAFFADGSTTLSVGSRRTSVDMLPGIQQNMQVQ